MMKIIGLCGKKGVGKDFVADQLLMVLNGKEVCRVAFADPIKDFCVNVLDLPDVLVRGNDNDKNTLTRYSWGKIPKDIRERFDAQPDSQMTIRHILQLFGTEICRFFFHEDIWIECMNRRIQRSKADYFVITDVRFENEIDLIRGLGGQLWEISGPQRGNLKKKDLHLSETSLNSNKVDIVVENGLEDTQETIQRKIRSFLGLA